MRHEVQSFRWTAHAFQPRSHHRGARSCWRPHHGARIGGLTSALVVGTASASTPPCGTAGVLSVAAGTSTCTYTSLGADTFTVPTGTTQVMVTAVGGAGGDGLTYVDITIVTGAAGGAGAEVTATVPVTGGSTLYPEVGSDGAPATGDVAPITCSPGAGGTNGGGAGGQGNCDDQSGGGGGGASDLRTSTSALTGVAGTDPRLVVAGGGGGGGGGYGPNGGAGGAAGDRWLPAPVPAARAPSSRTSNPVAPGASARRRGGGHPNTACAEYLESAPGGAGTAGSGGPGGDGYDVNAVVGGGGGGGFIGGGGGVVVEGNVGGGGGGGSSFIESAATNFSVSDGGPADATPEVAISWTTGASPTISTTPSRPRPLWAAPCKTAPPWRVQAPWTGRGRSPSTSTGRMTPVCAPRRPSTPRR